MQKCRMLTERIYFTRGYIEQVTCTYIGNKYRMKKRSEAPLSELAYITISTVQLVLREVLRILKYE